MATDKAKICSICPQGVGHIEEVIGIETVMPFVGHIIYLHKLLELGATIHLDDLSKQEWDGLILFKRVSSEVLDEHMKKEREKEKLKRSVSTGRRH